MSEPHEIVIIKRVGGDHEEGHHGGAWKIAFADFMTAMMAFFLVMWLISANDKTKAVIARYFNPVQLVDSTPQPKGLEDPRPGSPSVMPKVPIGGPEPKDKKEKPPEPKADPSDGKPSPKHEEAKSSGASGDEAALFRDPYAVLADIDAKNQPLPQTKPAAREESKADSEARKVAPQVAVTKTGEAFRDPFDPAPVPAPVATSDAVEALPPTEPAGAAASPMPSPAKIDVAGAPAHEAPKNTFEHPPASPPETKDGRPATLSAKIENTVKQDAGAGLPQVEVRHTAEGTVIDLTDKANFAMFSSASAAPSPKMVALMAKIGALLKASKGRITVRGYTDNRPFRSDTYDNWRLSAARAHMAHYMLVRGGLDEQRFDAIEGYGDRQPKNPANPGGPENRRIEIVVRDAP